MHWEKSLICKEQLDDVLAKLIDTYGYLHFPMNSIGNHPEGKAYHWTLLLFDTKVGVWYYNNHLSRTSDETNFTFLQG